MAGHLENQVLQWSGVDSTQPNDVIHQQKNEQQQEVEEIVKKDGSFSRGGAYYTSKLFFSPAGEYAPRLGAGGSNSSASQWGCTDGKFPSKEHANQSSMSGQHPHGRQAPPNSAWNHLQVPNYFPSRQPQHAHMSNELPMLTSHQPTWHTPTTEPSKSGLSHSPLFNLQQMLGTERAYPRHSPGVDLSVTRNGSQNGEMSPSTPISLSVRDAKQINSLADAGAAVELTKVTSPAPLPVTAPDIKPTGNNNRRPPKRVDSILERLNSSGGAGVAVVVPETKPPQSSVIVTAASSSHDENSNSSQGTVPPATPNPDDAVSPASNDDSLDGAKSRRKRKPSKTVKVSKDEDATLVRPEEPAPAPEPLPVPTPTEERRRSSSEPPVSPPARSRRKTVSESETIDNIAAMVAATAPEEASIPPPPEPAQPVSVITSCTVAEPVSDPVQVPIEVPVTIEEPTKEEPELVERPQEKTPAMTVAVEAELEKMFAGIGEGEGNASPQAAVVEGEVAEGSKLVLPPVESVSSTSGDSSSKAGMKRGRPRGSKGSPAGKKPKKKIRELSGGVGVKFIPLTKKAPAPTPYQCDSGSNASSGRSRGPFVQIRGPRDSPISVSVVNAPAAAASSAPATAEDKRFHDDSDYRQRVRSRGLHCSTLSVKYDANTRDASWVCAFCKRGPHAAEPTPATPDVPRYAPGDLFGPYVIGTDCPEYRRRFDDPFDAAFKSRRASTAAATASASPSTSAPSPRRSRTKSVSDSSVVVAPTYQQDQTMIGIVEISSGSYEVWLHEDCVVWGPGVYLVGPKIVGLEGAVWGACAVPCARCGQRGAAVCCMRRGCSSVVHIGCAIMLKWTLDHEAYKAYCPQHSPPD